MRNKHLVLLFAGATLTLGACSSDDDVLSGNNASGKDSEISEKTDTQQVVGSVFKTATVNVVTPAATLVSVYADRDCKEPLVTDYYATTDGLNEIKMQSSSDAKSVYVVYSSNGKKTVKSVSLDNNDKGEIRLPDNVQTYTTNFVEGTAFHSSGVVMFDSTWPYGKDGKDAFQHGDDFNDVVVDYDMESVVLNPSLSDFAAKDYKEGLKVTMHVRAVGSKSPEQIGLKLEGLDRKFIESSDCTIKLSGNDHQAEKDIPAGSFGVRIGYDGNSPVIYITNLQWLTSKDNTLNVSGAKYYNTERPSKEQWLEDGKDLINHGAPLFTVTVNFKGKLRSTMTDYKAADAQVAAYVNAVTNTASQNFFIVLGNGKEIHVAGYAPLDSYKRSYNSEVNRRGKLSKDVTYMSTDFGVWGVKVPVLTKHIYEGESFADTYKELKAWAESYGKQYTDWYLTQKADDTNLVKWW